MLFRSQTALTAASGLTKQAVQQLLDQLETQGVLTRVPDPADRRAKRIALTTNEEGSSVLRFLDLASFKELPRPALLPGEISGLRWSGGAEEDADGEDSGKELAFNVTSARSPGDVYSYNLKTTKLTRWTNSGSPTDCMASRAGRTRAMSDTPASELVVAPAGYSLTA